MTTKQQRLPLQLKDKPVNFKPTHTAHLLRRALDSYLDLIGFKLILITNKTHREKKLSGFALMRALQDVYQAKKESLL